MTISVREAPLDWDTFGSIIEMDSKCFGFDHSSLSFGGTWWWVAYLDGEPVGYAGLETLYDDRGFLCRSGVLPVARGRGLQRRLIRARERGARSRDMSRLVTYTSPINVRSSNNLIACGYQLYTPAQEWGCPDALYWYRDL